MSRVQLYLYRHGATAANLRREYLGLRDLPLAPEGRGELAGKQPAESVDLLFSSPLIRCRETAEILFPDQEFILLPEWTERDFGPYEGKRWEELKEGESYRRWIESEGRLSPHGMEAAEDFRRRIVSGFSRIEKTVNAYAPDERETVKIAAVAHGGTILEFRRWLWPERPFYEKMPGHGECSRFSFCRDRGRLLIMEDEDV